MYATRIFKQILMKYYLLFAIISISELVKAQSGDTALLRVKYKIIHIYDTTKPETPGEEVMQLYVGRNNTEFSSYEYETEYAKYHASRWENIGADGVIHRGANYPDNYERKSKMIQYSLGHEGNSFSVYNLVYQLYFGYPFDLPKIKWDITEETKTIQNLRCQKANAWVKGRFYEAWFAPELSFSSGPWKLNGLPGLILEASDAKQHVQFRFISLENVSKESHIIQLPPKVIKTSYEKFTALMEAVKLNPWILAKFNGATDEMSERFLKDNEELIAKVKMNNKQKTVITINNPVELTNK